MIEFWFQLNRIIVTSILYFLFSAMTGVINDKRDVTIPKKPPTELLLDKHIEFLVNYGKGDTHFEFVMAEFLRINGVYWSYTALYLMLAEDKLNKEEVCTLLFIF